MHDGNAFCKFLNASSKVNCGVLKIYFLTQNNQSEIKWNTLPDSKIHSF